MARSQRGPFAAQHIRPSGVQRVVQASSPPSPSSVLSLVSMTLLATTEQDVLRKRCWEAWVPFGEGGRSSLPRSRSPHDFQRVRPRYGPGWREMAEHAARRPTTELPFSTSAGERPSHTRSSLAREVEHGCWCWRWKWEVVSHKEQHPL